MAKLEFGKRRLIPYLLHVNQGIRPLSFGHCTLPILKRERTGPVESVIVKNSDHVDPVSAGNRIRILEI